MRQVVAVLRAVEKDPTSLSAQAAGGDGWSRTDHLLCLVLDQLRLANWQRSKDGSKNRNRPKPVSPLSQGTGKRTGKTNRPPTEVIAYLDRLHQRTPEEVSPGG